jgi:putative ABC transport system ATP-binding protein
MMTTPLLESRNIFKSFKLKNYSISVLRGVNLQVSRGEVITIKGRSGEGKSVLLWLLGGLDRPDEGEIFFDSTSFNSLSNGQIASLRSRHMGIIFQNFNLVPSWTALENVEAALIEGIIESGERKAKAKSILVSLGLGERLENLPGELSVGQQQRVAVARTLVNNPSLILADEPTGDVDNETAKEIMDLLFEPVRKNGTTLIIATHGNFSSKQVDRVLHLKNGQLTS